MKPCRMRFLRVVAFVSVVLFVPLRSQANIPKFFKVDAGLYRGAQPENVLDYQMLKALGIKTIMNLRETPQDISAERIISRRLNIGFMSFPIDGGGNPDPQEVTQIMMELGTPGLLPIFIHCQAGKDRTGMIVGLYRVEYQHWSANDAYKEMISFGFDPNLRGLYNYFWAAVKSAGVFR